ncbi:hypothetical protein C0J52_13984 [Blattella germanica]|nr:hypothetical protein C0J52_13984 [Blattella germanica]
MAIMKNTSIHLLLFTSLVLFSNIFPEVTCLRNEDLFEVTAITIFSRIWNDTVQNEWNEWINSQRHGIPRCKMSFKVDYNVTRIPAVIVKVKHCILDIPNMHGFRCKKHMKQINVINLETGIIETENIAIACHTVRIPSFRASTQPSFQMNTVPLPYPV